MEVGGKEGLRKVSFILSIAFRITTPSGRYHIFSDNKR